MDKITIISNIFFPLIAYLVEIYATGIPTSVAITVAEIHTTKLFFNADL